MPTRFRIRLRPKRTIHRRPVPAAHKTPDSIREVILPVTEQRESEHSARNVFHQPASHFVAFYTRGIAKIDQQQRRVPMIQAVKSEWNHSHGMRSVGSRDRKST